MLIANPIYDIVFKYMLEDNEAAKTFLSALLKREVVDVVAKRNEYCNITTDNLSIFRIDFGATVVEPDGSLKLITVELQKTWVDNETLRFRRYLSVQYGDEANIIPESKDGFARPMVSVYILGHRVGDIEEPILYVRRKAFDYDGKEVTKGIPDPFVDSLTHDSIIVQIPLLTGQMNNPSERMLNIFSQVGLTENGHTREIDESCYESDPDMMHLLMRLNRASATSEVRKRMNAEDDFLKVIERRDTAILQLNSRLKEKDAQLKSINRKVDSLVQNMLNMGLDREVIEDLLQKCE